MVQAKKATNPFYSEGDAKKRKQQEHDHEDVHDMPSFTPEMHDPDAPIWVNKFTEDAARAFVKQLMYQSNKDPSAPIVIYIDSFGGEVYALNTMIDAMEACPNQLITVALGKAMSAGAVLLACGHIRYAAPHTSIMIHEASGGAIGHVADMNIQQAEMLRLNESMLKILVERCKIKGGISALKKTLEKSRDLYMTPKEAVAFGLIDKIGVPTLVKQVSVKYGLSTPGNAPQPQQGASNEKSPGKSKA